MPTDIDLVEYGEMRQQVRETASKVASMEKKIDQLVDLASRGKGGLWLGMTIVAAFGGVSGFMLSMIKGH